MVTISAQLAALNNSSQAVTAYTNSNPEPFRPRTTAAWIDGFWLSSLALSLITAMFRTHIRHWATSYRKLVRQDQPLHKQGVVHAYLFAGLKKWKVSNVVDFIPTLIQITLALFLVGLSLFLWDINQSLAAVIIAFAAVSSLADLFASLGALLVYDFPYHTPLSHSIYQSVLSTICSIPFSKRRSEFDQIHLAATQHLDSILKRCFELVVVNISEKDMRKLAESLPGIFSMDVRADTLTTMSQLFFNQHAPVLTTAINEPAMGESQGDIVAPLLGGVCAALRYMPRRDTIGPHGLSESWVGRCRSFLAHDSAAVVQSSMPIYAHLTKAIYSKSNPGTLGNFPPLSLPSVKELRKCSIGEGVTPWSLLMKCFTTTDPNTASFIGEVWPEVYSVFAGIETQKELIQDVAASVEAQHRGNLHTAFAEAATIILKKHKEDTGLYYNELSKDILEFVRACRSLTDINPQAMGELEQALQVEHGDVRPAMGFV